MINSFKDYLIEEERVVYFTFGAMNPPTIEHGKLIDKLASVSGKNPYRIFVAQSQDKSKNPLSYSDKIKSIRKMFPKHGRNVTINKNVRKAIDVLPELYDQGFRKVVMVVGQDRVNQFEALFNKYNGKDGPHGFYNFSDISVVSAGIKDPDVKQSSEMRTYVEQNDFTSFSQNVSKEISTKDVRKMFNDVRKGLGLSEEVTFKNHVQLNTVSETREAFVAGNLFTLGESVVIKKTDEVGTITVLGSNYVIVETSDNRKRYWLDAVEKIEEDNKKSMYKDKPDWGTPESAKKAKSTTPGQTEVAQDPDIKDRPGTQPKVYHAGVSKKQKSARDAQFKRQAKMSDDNPAAYKDAPGDKKAREQGTKKSKYTLKFKRMYGENSDPVDAAKNRIDRQKKIAARRHDKIMDRARLLKTKQKNKETE